MALIDVTCPCCGEVLSVDTAAKTAQKNGPAKSAKVDLEGFLKGQKNRVDDLEALFKKSSEESRKRQVELEQGFRKAAENPDSVEGEYQSPFQWD